MWYCYILECSDSTLYTGITTNIERRLKEHNLGKGAKYTCSRIPVVLKWSCEFKNRSEASKEEYRIKKLSKIKKIEIINGICN
jgi:putative endonuclease